jgi:hypothetical protein
MHVYSLVTSSPSGNRGSPRIWKCRTLCLQPTLRIVHLGYCSLYCNLCFLSRIVMLACLLRNYIFGLLTIYYFHYCALTFLRFGDRPSFRFWICGDGLRGRISFFTHDISESGVQAQKQLFLDRSDVVCSGQGLIHAIPDTGLGVTNSIRVD